MVILNPKQADSKAGTSGTDEAVVWGDLWGWAGARPLSTTFPLYCLGGGWLPYSISHEGAESLEYANFLPLIGGEPLGEESDD